MEWAARLLVLLFLLDGSLGQNYYYAQENATPQQTRPPSRPFLSSTTARTTTSPTPTFARAPATRPTRYAGAVGSTTSTTPRTDSVSTGNQIDDNLSFENCGKRATRPAALITNALPTFEGEFPWHAAIFARFSSRDLPKYACGGSLISKRAVLTAGHCVTSQGGNRRAEDDITVYLGKYQKNEGWNMDRGVQSFTPQRLLVHPNYNKDNLTSDLAVIFFSRDAILNNKVAVVCLWNYDNSLENLVNQQGTVVGWGIMDINRNVDTNILQKAKFPVHSFETCVRSKPEFFTTILARNNTYCAGYSNGTSACNGDSGGGMTFERGGRWYLRGVVSIGVPLETDPTLCNPKYYTVYSDVSKYLEWIAQNVDGVNVIEPRILSRNNEWQ